ncbi:hypothetical protein SELMODRAFT_233855 [Selaginella moellendorffii]|uniref:SCP domain-containing protein n=2 Tax=Selaginella moellendorffii TaxID=88036 RepID=D8SF50_SELML|nr:hypothetical protein SELMODRAFT_234936 [Selaginella moellendorffii]EFJ16979.1 hypothetical protein SELMODRAFT_233855 [Selaginella moellendorffii]
MMPQNDARARLGLRPLIWDSKLQAFAEDWANQRARYGNCYLQHSNGPYGENIFWGGGKAWSPAEAANAWIEERNWYNYGSNSCQSGQQCGHYTQIVWRDSERIGCARVTCSSGDVFMTCNYDPPGNYIGEKPY